MHPPCCTDAKEMRPLCVSAAALGLHICRAGLLACLAAWKASAKGCSQSQIALADSDTWNLVEHKGAPTREVDV